MRSVVIGVAIVALLAGCGGSSHSAATTTVSKLTHAQIVAAAKAKAAAAADARLLAKNGAKARAQGYEVHAGDVAGLKLLNTKLSHRGCDEFGNHGCWRVDILVFKHCDFFELDINELRGGKVLQTYVDNQSDVAPNTVLHGEFDATDDGVNLGTPVYTCTENS